MVGFLFGVICVAVIMMAAYAHVSGNGKGHGNGGGNGHGRQTPCAEDGDCAAGLVCIPSSPGGSSACGFAPSAPSAGDCEKDSDRKEWWFSCVGGRCGTPLSPLPVARPIPCAQDSDCGGKGLGPVAPPGGWADGFRTRSTPPPRPCEAGWHRVGGHCELEPPARHQRPGGWPRVGPTAHA